MRKLAFQRWCSRAVAGIHTSPDKENVSQELFDHLEDCYQALIADGIEPREAERRAIAAMGDVEELSRSLAAIHRPFWGMLELIFRRTLVILAFITLLSFGFYFLENFFFDPAFHEFDPNAGPSVSGEIRQIRSLEPNCTVSSDGYTITVERASIWERTYESLGKTQEYDYCNIQLQVFNPFPWADAPDFSGWYWAQDSLGNYYYSACEDSAANESSIQATDYRTGLLTYIQDLWLSPYCSQEAQWIELHYDRSGRDIVLHIDLSGGEQP